jgi:predicted tellurium resistance membrane protein TerC
MALEIILGIDNVVCISILVSRCTREQALRARQIGLSLAFVFRVVMLFSLTSLMKLTYSLFSIFGVGISWRDLILSIRTQPGVAKWAPFDDGKAAP